MKPTPGTFKRSPGLNQASSLIYFLKTAGLGLALGLATLSAYPQALPRSSGPEASSEPLTKAEKAISGNWTTIVNVAAGQHAGAMALQSNRVAIIAPDDFVPLVGTWHATKTEIDIDVKDRGTAKIAYTLSKSPETLVLHYDANAVPQSFHRVMPEKKKTS